MALLEIRKYPDSILRKKTSPVTEFDSSLQKLIDDMIETMYAAPGVGLAANQVGVSKQIAVIDVSEKDNQPSLFVLINPEIIHAEGEAAIEEGCLSVPGYTTVVKRAEKVKVCCRDREGKEVEIEGNGIFARALQHEIDHLNGILLIDRIGRIKKEFFKKRYKREHKTAEASLS
jgi:peptide deformylase